MNRQRRFTLIYLLVLLTVFSGGTGWAANLKCGQLLIGRAGISRAIKWNLFVTGRTLSEYRQGLHKDFNSSLQALKFNETWIDLGAGKGNAAIDYLKEITATHTSANVVLIAYKLDRWFNLPKFNNKLSVIEGRLFEEIPSVEIPKAKLITDYYGVLSYTRDLSRTLALVFDRLEVGGELYIHSLNSSTLIDFQNKVYSMTDFLKQIDGLRVEGTNGILKITKLREDVQFSELRLTRLIEEEIPAFRRFSY